MSERSSTLTRRQTIAAVGATTVWLSGCSGLLGSDGGEAMESFEDGLGPSIFEDASQTDGEVSVTDEHATHGDSAALMDSSPGTSSSSRVRTEDTRSGSYRYTAAVKPLVVDGPHNSISVSLHHPDDGRRIDVHSSGYHGGTQYQESDEAGEEVTSTRTGVGAQLPVGEWTRLGVAVRENEIETVVGETTETVDAAWNPIEDPVHLRLVANAWGSGHAVSAAFDEVRIEQL